MTSSAKPVQLVQVAQALPTQFTTVTDFFDNVLEDVRQLPVVTLKILISTLRLPPRLQIAFNNNLLLPLISGSVPDLLRNEPTQQHFESRILLLKGTNQNCIANAKIALILEQMFIYMMNHKTLAPTKVLRKAVEVGIEGRHDVNSNEKRRKRNIEENKLAVELMLASSERLLGLLEMLEISAGIAPQPWTTKDRSSTSLALLSFGSGSPLSSAPDTATEADESTEEDN